MLFIYIFGSAPYSEHITHLTQFAQQTQALRQLKNDISTKQAQLTRLSTALVLDPQDPTYAHSYQHSQNSTELEISILEGNGNYRQLKREIPPLEKQLLLDAQNLQTLKTKLLALPSKVDIFSPSFIQLNVTFHLLKLCIDIIEAHLYESESHLTDILSGIFTMTEALLYKDIILITSLCSLAIVSQNLKTSVLIYLQTLISQHTKPLARCPIDDITKELYPPPPQQ